MISLGTKSLLLLALAATGLGCGGDDAVSHSEPVGIELKADADKVVAGVLSDAKNITTESGNPYGAFVNEARTVLGKDPGRIEVTGVTLLLGADATGVVSLGEIFDGNVEVLVEMADTGDTFAVAHGTIDESRTGSAPVTLAVDFDADAFTGANFDKLVGGNFTVVYRGPTQAAFAATGAKADLQITLTFAAFE